MTQTYTGKLPFFKRLGFSLRRLFIDGELFRKISKKKKDILFYALLAIIPIAQFIIFYIVVNINSILLAFQHYSFDDNGVLTITFAGFDNFVQVFKDLFGGAKFELVKSWGNSLICYGVGLFFGMPFSLIFSFYIYKKFFGHKFFKLFLFLPSIISSIALIIMFTYFYEEAYPDLMKMILNLAQKPNGLLYDPKTTLFSVLFYATFCGFGGSVIMYSSAMSGINSALPEAAKIDGASSFQEFIYVTLPSIFPTLTTFIVVGIAGIFTNQASLYGFFGGDADLRVYTFGYYLYKGTLDVKSNYPYLAAFGLVLTAITVPLTYGVKWALEKFGPRKD